MAPSRNFDNVDDKIDLSLGACNFAFGPGTLAVILKRAGTSNDVILGAGNTTTTRYGMYLVATSNAATVFCNAVDAMSTFTVLPADGWCVLAVTKATGSVAPRFHKYVFSTRTWTHENSGTAIANSSVPDTNVYFGRNSDSNASFFFGGHMAMAGVWNSVLNDAQIEALTVSEAAWLAAAPSGLWILDQTDVGQSVSDETGNGANQSAITGTTIGEDFNFPLIGNSILKPNVLRPALFAPGRAR